MTTVTRWWSVMTFIPSIDWWVQMIWMLGSADFKSQNWSLWMCYSRSFEQEINILFIVLCVRKSLVDMDTNTPSSISEIGWSWRVSPSKMLTKYISKTQQKLFPFNLGHRYLTNLILSQRGFVHRGFLNIINSMQSSRQSTHVLDCWPKDHYKNRIRKTIKQESWPREV